MFKIILLIALSLSCFSLPVQASVDFTEGTTLQEAKRDCPGLKAFPQACNVGSPVAGKLVQIKLYALPDPDPIGTKVCVFGSTNYGTYLYMGNIIVSKLSLEQWSEVLTAQYGKPNVVAANSVRWGRILIIRIHDKESLHLGYKTCYMTDKAE